MPEQALENRETFSVETYLLDFYREDPERELPVNFQEVEVEVRKLLEVLFARGISSGEYQACYATCDIFVREKRSGRKMSVGERRQTTSFYERHFQRESTRERVEKAVLAITTQSPDVPHCDILAKAVCAYLIGRGLEAYVEKDGDGTRCVCGPAFGKVNPYWMWYRDKLERIT